MVNRIRLGVEVCNTTYMLFIVQEDMEGPYDQYLHLYAAHIVRNFNRTEQEEKTK